MIEDDSLASLGSDARHGNAVDLSLILVTHNSSRVLPGFVSSLEEHAPACRWELVIVDNASSDDSVSLLRARFPEALVVENSRNCGFATAVNAAADRARGGYYLLVNPDIAWGHGAIERLVEFMSDHPRAGAVTPRLCYPDGRAQPSLRRFPTHGNIWFSRGVHGVEWLCRVVNWYPYTLPDPGSASRIEAAAAACLLVRSSAFSEVGKMDEGYFLYVEDTDLCRRLIDAGWETWIDPEIYVTHQWGRGSLSDRQLKSHHRDGIRRYFRKFHREKHVRNSILFLVLWLADLTSRISGSKRRTQLG